MEIYILQNKKKNFNEKKKKIVRKIIVSTKDGGWVGGICLKTTAEMNKNDNIKEEKPLAQKFTSCYIMLVLRAW